MDQEGPALRLCLQNGSVPMSHRPSLTTLTIQLKGPVPQEIGLNTKGQGITTGGWGYVPL